MANVQKVTDDNFQDEVLSSKGVTVVDVYTEWCAPCKMLAPIIESVSADYNGKVKVASLDAESNAEIAGKYNVLSVPTILFFKDGELVDTSIGLISKESLKDKIDSIS